ncbi:MAG: hypothetical protein EOL95_04555 [Bacteroidia bacterium]|nr:hypothetical protein [Bacteroidia bacterium]
MNKLLLAISMLFAAIVVNADNNTSAYYNSETECLGVELDGSQTLRVWANGRNKTDAVEQCKKNAVNEVIFNGIKNGNGGCNKKPLITEVNAKEKYEYYFNIFFKDDGEYKKYISMEDSRTFTKKRLKRSEQVKYGITVRVNRGDLQDRLIKDGIIKQ